MDAAALADRLARAGLDAPAAQAKAAMFARLAEHLAKHTSTNPARALAFFVPGRVEVLGKHTDYAGGRTLVMAVDRGFCLLVHPRSDDQVRLFNVAQSEQACCAIDPDLAPSMGHWMNYPQTVVRRLARNFPQARCGADIAFLSDLPRSSGMSSSSAMIVAIYLALAAVNRIEQLPAYQHNITSQEDLAGYLGTIENGQTFGTLAGDRGVGTFGGSEDHTAILCSQPGRLSQYRYCPVRLERRIALPDDLRFLIAFSGAHAEKTGGARELYNRASLLAQHAAQAWRQATGREDAHLAAAGGLAPGLCRMLCEQ
jgi:galactokinase